MAENQDTPKIIIVGAGIAGVSAAKSLIESGFDDLVILEAKNRIGGRIWTQEYGDDGVLDIGAQFIHGQGENPIYKIASQHDLVYNEDLDEPHRNLVKVCDAADASVEVPDLFYTSQGKRIDPAIIEETCNILDDIFDEGNKFSRSSVPPIAQADESIGTFVHRAFYKYLRTCDDPTEVRNTKEGIFNWRLLRENIDNACKSVYELSLYAWGEYLEFDGNSYVELKKGFQSILDSVASVIPQEKIKLNSPVHSIHWDQQSTVDLVVDCPNDGSFKIQGTTHEKQKQMSVVTAGGQVYNADHVIVACSLGFLKRQAHTLFRPLLPNDKMAAIHRMGYGTVDKIYLEFKRPFWDKDCDGIHFAWLNNDPFFMESIENKYQEELLPGEWYKGILGFDTVTGHPNLLEGWIAGEEARLMETLPEHTVLDVCHQVLKRFIGDTTVEKPTRIIRTRWSHDEYNWGSYSYIKVGNTAADCDILASPIPSKQIPQLLFAGEATHRAYYSTTHGALLSGQREAQRILDFHQPGP